MHRGRLLAVAFLGAGIIASGPGCGSSGAPASATLEPVQGEELLAAVQKPGAAVVLVNMWATWCGPCREEFPDLIRLAREYRHRGLRTVLVSWDVDAAVARRFLARQGVDFPSYIKGPHQSDPAFVAAIAPSWSGAFPATMIFDGRGRLRDVLEGRQTLPQLEAAVRAVLDQPTPANGGPP